MDCSTPGFPVHHQLPEIAQTHVHRIGDTIHPSHLLSSPSPGDQSSWGRLKIFPSIRVFSKESVLRIRWPKYWSFSFHICPSNEYSGLISFRMDWFDLLAVQGTLKSSPTLHLKASILRCSAFFTVQFSHPHVTTGTIAHIPAMFQVPLVVLILSVNFDLKSKRSLVLLSLTLCIVCTWYAHRSVCAWLFYCPVLHTWLPFHHLHKHWNPRVLPRYLSKNHTPPRTWILQEWERLALNQDFPDFNYLNVCLRSVAHLYIIYNNVILSNIF